ncbi:hypothetical protein GIB67_023828 [Kingdonia uniflora]|uniref:C3H1-type domain-containing protein n=1 Tax=Kingdonia uniflora TaxID=39325 RepID=A0A7J7NGV6_9MAGN|nr:hypothetical protein GIB67_023828 [Kingdonia uniflora]
MEEEGALSFDFEGGLDTVPSNSTATVPLNIADPSPMSFPNMGTNNLSSNGGPPNVSDSVSNNNHFGRNSFRKTVCRHWLRGLCMKGDGCGFLHQYDKARMPICRFFRLYGECREQDCVYKHTNEDIKECNMYKLGFCPNGPDCRYRHAKLPGPPPLVEEVFQKIQNQNSFNYGYSNRFFQPRSSGYNQQTERFPFPQGPNVVNQAVGAKQFTTAESPVMQQQSQVQQPQEQQVNQNQMNNLPDALANQGTAIASPLPPGLSRCVQTSVLLDL